MKVTIQDERKEPGLIKMSEMKPLQIAEIVMSGEEEFIGNIVMRTDSLELKVIDLTDFGPRNFWRLGDGITVRPLDAELIVKINGD
jgi:hypothetical protein